MIKLIASDMDGTLLNDKSQLNREAIDTIKELNSMGLSFVAASGRQFSGLYRMFEEVRNDISYVVENGAFAVYNGKEVYSSIMDRYLLNNILKELSKFDVAEVMLLGKYCAYTTDPKIADIMRGPSHRYNIQVVDSLFDLDEEIIKLSVRELDGNNKISFENLYPMFKDKACITISGFDWYDFMNVGVNKGNTLKIIQEILDITLNETAVFGDNFNDIEMLQSGYYSYAMGDAHDDVKKHARFVIGDNNDDAVIYEMKKIKDRLI